MKYKKTVNLNDASVSYRVVFRWYFRRLRILYTRPMNDKELARREHIRAVS